MSANIATALLLEDEPLISLDLEEILGDAGFVVSTAMSCVEAEGRLSDGRPDIAIVDIMLRDGPADRVVERLIEDRIPFLVHSGDHPSQHVGTPFEQGIWIPKPAEAEELVKAALGLLVV